MTTIYFIRHAEPNFNIHDDHLRPLTLKGQRDCSLVTEFLKDKQISVVLSSPYVRAYDTVAPFAAAAGLEIKTVDDFRERKVADDWILPFEEFTQKQWGDFTYKLPSGESLSEVQARNITALEKVLAEYPGQNIAIGTHGTALSTIIHYYDNSYSYEGFSAMKRIFPWVAKMEFDGSDCASIEKIDLFQPVKQSSYEQCLVHTAPLGSMKAYKYTVIFSRYKDKWLYSRHKERDGYETAGGHIEPGESVLDAAKRELFEETGAVKFDIAPVFDYSVHLPNTWANGRVFLAHIHELGEMPDFEMAETKLFNTIPEKMRFPMILPVLFEYLQQYLQQEQQD